MSTERNPLYPYLVDAVTAGSALVGLAYLGMKRAGAGTILLVLATVAVLLVAAASHRKRKRAGRPEP
jgi:hypothetical protein